MSIDPEEPLGDRRGSEDARRRWRFWRSGWRYVLTIVVPTVITAIITASVTSCADEATRAAKEAYWRHYQQGVIEKLHPAGPKP